MPIIYNVSLHIICWNKSGLLGIFNFKKDDFGRISHKRAISSVYEETFGLLSSSYPWQLNPEFLAIADSIHYYWSQWEETILDMITSSGGDPISFKLEHNSLDQQQISEQGFE